MNRIPPLRALLLPLMIAACSAPAPRQSPAPVYRSSPAPVTPDRGQGGAAQPAAPAREEEIRAYDYESGPLAEPEPVAGPAVVALLDSADGQARAGDLSGAVVTLERALRIEPRNARLWNRLARLRLRQGRYAMAADLAAKSNSLAGTDRALKKANWGLIEQAKRASGDVDGARAARRQANRL